MEVVVVLDGLADGIGTFSEVTMIVLMIAHDHDDMGKSFMASP